MLNGSVGSRPEVRGAMRWRVGPPGAETELVDGVASGIWSPRIIPRARLGHILRRHQESGQERRTGIGV